MIYTVDHVYTDPATEGAWHEWYAGYLQKLLAVPGIHTAQRFKALGCTPSRYLAMYSIDSADVYTSEPYKSMGGGGSQSARFHHAYQVWTRNLFDAVAPHGAQQAKAIRAPAVRNAQRVLVFDRDTHEEKERFGTRATWLEAVGLHMTTKYRAFVVLDTAAEFATMPSIPGSYLYEPFTPVMLKTAIPPQGTHTTPGNIKS